MTSTLPADWEEQERLMNLRIVYLVLAYKIPPALVVNADQTALMLMPVGDERTYTLEGTKDVAVSGRGDKR